MLKASGDVSVRMVMELLNPVMKECPEYTVPTDWLNTVFLHADRGRDDALEHRNHRV